MIATATGVREEVSKRTSSWLHVGSHIDPRFGGIAKVLPELCSAVSMQSGCKSEIVAFCDRSEGSGLDAKVPVSCVPGAGEALLRRKLGEADGLHIHGIWEPHCAAAGRVARAAKKPYVLAAHGMLEPWALRNKRWKKAIYSALVERSNVGHASCLHALTRAEADNYRAYGVRNPIAVIPNGVRIPSDVQPDLFLDRFPYLADKRYVLFLGRVHYKKGLNLLVEAWRHVTAEVRNVHLVIAGPDDENTQAPLEQAISRHGLSPTVTFTGMLGGPMKWSALSSCHVFVLPSWSEGFSVSVLEAMGMEKPVIVTKQCNVPEVGKEHCGWVIDPDAEQLASALIQSLRAPAGRVREMGSNGAALVRRSYNWDSIGEKMISVYRWLQGGPRPVDVDLRTY